jgi:2-polyprenyl-3-methyl-5-hydroxy-6-metoxy-1,4-benzoquinol methylase
VIDFQDHKLNYVCARAEGKSVLDLGCVSHNVDNEESRYWLHKALKQVAAELVGLDYLPEAVETLKQRGYDVVCGDAQDYDLGRKFDVIVAGDIVEHLNNQEGFLKSSLRHLNEGGMIIVSTPNPWFWKLIVNSIRYREVPNNPEHTCWFDPRTYRQLVERFDLELSQVEFGSRYLRDRIMPLPRGIKHTSWHGVLTRAGG